MQGLGDPCHYDEGSFWTERNRVDAAGSVVRWSLREREMRLRSIEDTKDRCLAHEDASYPASTALSSFPIVFVLCR